MKIKLFLSLLFLLFTSSNPINSFAQTGETDKINQESKQMPLRQPKMYVAPTSDGFGNFVSAALIENKVPVQITASEENADFIVVGSSARGQNRWYDTVFGVERDRNQGSIKVIRVADKTIVWASASGDRSLWWNGLKATGQSKVANRLARKMKDDIKKILAGFDPSQVSTEAKTANANQILNQEMPAAMRTATRTTKDPKTHTEYNQRGFELFQQGNLLQAEADFREAVKLEPYNATYHHNLGAILNAQKKYEEAEVEVELATRLAPNDPVFKKSLEAIRQNRNGRTIIKVN